MKISSAFGKVAAVLSVGLIAASANAGFWDWTRPFKGPGRHVSTLVITANYKRPLALAQLMRAENRQPYLLIPAQESGLKDVFFCPVNENTPARRLRPEDITRFVQLLNPSKIIILGDVRYVPQQYVPQVEKYIPIVRIDCDDWNRTAQQVHNHVRGLHPWPVATAVLGGTLFKIHETAVVSGSGQPGAILELTKTGLKVACGEGAVEIRQLQAEGGKRMAAPDYFRGHPLEIPL